MTDAEQTEIDALRAEIARIRKWEMLPGMIAMSLITILAFAVACLFLRPMPMTEAAGTLAVALVSSVATSIGTIVGFYFGDTKGGREQAATIREQAKVQADAAPAKVAEKVAVAVAAAMAPTNGAAETAAWTDAGVKNTKEAYEDYLAKFPLGAHAADAKARI